MSIEGLAEYDLPGGFTQEHLANNWFYPPEAASFPKIHALEANVWDLKRLHQPVNLLVRRHQNIDHYIGKKRRNPFAAATGAVVVLVTLMSADFRKIALQESGCFFSELDVASYPSPEA